MINKIIVNNVWKKFDLGISNKKNALESIIYKLSGKEPKKNFWALKDISFTAEEGDIIGIIGKNGSGKSTLLRTISGVYEKDKGEIKIIQGKIIFPVNLHEGLKLRLTMKDNIFLCCSLFGLTNKEIKARFNEIVKFADLEKYVNTKLYQFSNGMLVRLTSAIGFCSVKKRDILLIDDGSDMVDKNFKEKCILKIREIIKNGSIVLFVSHDLESIKKLCNRIIWINEGKIIKNGGKEVLKEYISKSLDKNS